MGLEVTKSQMTIESKNVSLHIVIDHSKEKYWKLQDTDSSQPNSECPQDRSSIFDSIN